MEIVFNKHTLKRYAERMSAINGSGIKGKWIKIENLEKEIRRSGIFYNDPKREDSFYCVVSNLKVYRGFVGKDTLHITTCYPYKQSLKGLLTGEKRLYFPDL
jgi:negative regulator of genetic competence, sporulation and motility